MRDRIDGALFRDMIICAADALENNKGIINELNVFPVPDGDTGTNMSLTVGNAAIELRKKSSRSISAVADTVATATLRGARGNSGVIISLLFRGISKSLKGKDEADALQFAVAMAEGVDAAYRAVMKPAEGTILTVSREATKSAVEFADAGSDIELMLVCALQSAKEALEKTVLQNPTLKRAGVIDAGGKGYVLMLDAMLATLQGRSVPAPSELLGERKERADFTEFESGDILFAYCSEFIVGRTNKKAPELLLAFLESTGDSVVLVDDDEIIKVHVHTNDPGQILTEALTYGPLISVKIENMREQHTELSLPAETPPVAEESKSAPNKKFGVVSVCAGSGMVSLFRDLGVDGVVSGGQSMNPSTEDILKEIGKTPAETVFVFPNNKNIIMTAEQCVPLSEKKVVVIPTKSVPQGVTAMLGFDPELAEEDLREVFLESMKNVHTAVITHAARDSDFDGHSIKENEYLVLMDGSLVGNYADFDSTSKNICEAFSKFDVIFVTVYYGEDISESEAQRFAATINAAFPDAEISVISGGQPVYCYMISVE